jgi:HD-GYP domain-containing protein (c-di-GMP phosphodiesterase class II)
MSTATDPQAGAPRWIPLRRSAGVKRLLSTSRTGAAERMPASELRAEAIIALAFLMVSVPLAMLAPGRGNRSAWVVLLFVGLYAVTSRIHFDVGVGYAVPTELVVVPMLLVLPAGWVPLLVAASFILGAVPSFISGKRHPERMVVGTVDAAHVVGPALVISLARLDGPHWSDWAVLLAALIAQFAFDIGANAARDWLSTDRGPELPNLLTGQPYLVDLCLSPIGLVIAFVAVAHPAAALVSLPLSGLLVFFARDRRARLQATVELSRAYRGTALLLGDVVEADDAYTGVHSRDVVELSMAVGPRLGLDADQLRHLEFTALLHDVGKIAIPKEIINKPGRLTDEERAVIETHTIEGERMLERVGGMLGEVGRLVRSCHERYDGLGYPDGLAGEAIPIEARIVCCCDAFNAMTTDRPYRGALSRDEALGELNTHRGTQFDPSVVDVLLALHEGAAQDLAAAARSEAGELMSAA